jgi:hypothetical protein
VHAGSIPAVASNNINDLETGREHGRVQVSDKSVKQARIAAAVAAGAFSASSYEDYGERLHRLTRQPLPPRARRCLQHLGARVREMAGHGLRLVAPVVPILPNVVELVAQQIRRLFQRRHLHVQRGLGHVCAVV